MHATYAKTVYGYMPVIDHPDRCAFVRFARFPRKTKATAEEAIRYAELVVHYRRLRQRSKAMRRAIAT